MSESVAFELQLLADKVVGPAKWAADAIAQVEKRAQKAQQALTFKTDIDKVQAQIRRLASDPSGFQALIKAQRQLADERRKLGAGFKDSLKTSLGFGGGGVGLAAGIGSVIGGAIVSAASGLLDLGRKLSGFLVDGFERAVRVAGQRQVLGLGERLSLGKTGAKNSAEDVGRFAKLTGMDDDQIRAMLLPLRRAGFDQKGARTAFAAASDIAAGEGRGGDRGRIGGLLESFQEIFLKGGIRKRSLPGLGVGVKEFYDSLSKQLKVSPKSAEKMAEEGKVDPQRLLNTVYEQIENKQHGTLGTGTVAYSKTLTSRIEKLKGLPDQFLAELSNSSGFSKLSDKLGGILEALDPDGPRGQRIIASLERAFNRMVEMIGGPEKAADNVADAVESIISAVTELTPLIFKVIGALVDAAAYIGDLVRAYQMLSALQRGDTAAVSRIAREQVAVDQGRAQREADREQRAYNSAHPEQVSQAPGPWMDASPQRPQSGGRGGTTINAPMPITVVAAPGEDPNHTAQKVSEAVGRHVVNTAERAAQQAGG